MKKYPRRIISVLLSLLMITSMFSSLGLVSFAEDAEVGATDVSIEPSVELDSNFDLNYNALTLTIKCRNVPENIYKVECDFSFTPADKIIDKNIEAQEDGSIRNSCYFNFEDLKYHANALALSSTTLPESFVIGKFVMDVYRDLESVTVDFKYSFYENNKDEPYTASFTKEIFLEEKNEFEFSERPDGTLTLACYKGRNLEVTVPDSYDGKTVTGIDKSAFTYGRSSSVTKIVLPDTVTDFTDMNGSGSIGVFTECKKLEEVVFSSVTEIPGFAFYGCDNLKKVILSDSLEYIGTRAFMKCTSLSEIKIPSSVKKIEMSAFRECSALEYIEIPEKITKISRNAFSDCTSLKSVKLPENLLSIDAGAFVNCESLQSIVIPEHVANIGEVVFSGCTSLGSITVPDTLTDLNASQFSDTAYYKNDANWKNGVLFMGNNIIATKPDVVTGKYVIPDSVISLGEGAFKDCDKLTSITIPDSVRILPSSVFSGCSSLEKINFPKSLAYIGSNAFSGCKSLRAVTVPDTVFKIETSIFSDCAALSDITIPDSVHGVGFDTVKNTAFVSDKNNWDGDVLYIGNHLISCKNKTIKGVFTVRDGTVSIGSEAFKNCDMLTGVKVPDSVTEIGDAAFANNANLEMLDIAGDVEVNWNTIVGTKLFEDSSLWDDGILYVGKNLLKAADSVSGDIKIKDGVKWIYSDAFFANENITGVTVPDSVEYIGHGAFRKCTALKSINISDNVKNLDKYVFLESGYYNDDSNWIDDVLYIGNYLVDARFGDDAEHYTIRDGAVSVCDGAFANIKSLKSVTIPSSVRMIGDCAFLGTAVYENEDYNIDGVFYIGNYLIDSDSDSVSGSVDIKDGTEVVACGAFFHCLALTDVSIPSSVKFIGDEAFADTGITNVFIGKNVEDIGENAFGYVPILSYVVPVRSVTISGYSGSAAERFANKNNFVFIPGCEHTETVIKNSRDATGEEGGYTGDTYCASCGDKLSGGHFVITGDTRMISDFPHDSKGITVADFKSRLNGDAEFDVADDALVYSGMKFKLNGKEYTVTVKGDVNSDGKITAADARIILRIAAKLETADDIMKNGADLNFDGMITAAEARSVLRFAARLTNSLQQD